jgi:ribonuclease E
MTRKRVGQGLLEVFSEPCEHCRGRGVLVHTDPVDDKKRNSGGNGGGNAGSGNGGGNAGGRNRDQNRGGADQGTTSGGGNGRGDQQHRDAAETVETPAEEPVTGEPAEATEQTGEGRSGRRSRGRRGRGQSGEARAAEDAAVLAGARDDDPADEPDAGGAEDELLPAGETAVEEPTPDTVLAAQLADPSSDAPVETPAEEPAETPVEAVDDVPVAVVDEVPVAEPEPAVVVAPQPVAEPVAAEAPAVARPRRRRAASRPAGPPAS